MQPRVAKAQESGKSQEVEKEVAKEVAKEGVKKEARRLVEQLPDSATWEDLMYKIYVRESIERGIEDSDAGRTTPVEEVRARFGLTG